MTNFKWIPPELLPLTVPGQYLVWISNNPRPLAVLSIMKISNGYLKIIDGHFVSDYLDDKTKIVAWAYPPEGPVE